jgi:PAS domain S-box-containing protein
MFRNLSLLTKMTLVIALVLFTFFSLGAYLDYRRETEQGILNAVDKARILSLEAIRGREYLSDQYERGQVVLSDRRFGLIPVVASGRIGQQVADDMGYRLRQVSNRFRNPANAPDAFEKEGLTRLQQDGKQDESYAMTSLDGKPVLRYLRPFRAKLSCLQCHGAPDQAPDFIHASYPVTSDNAYHYQVGELIGAASIIIPMDQVQSGVHQALRAGMVQRLGIFAALVLALSLLTRKVVVDPLRRLGEVIREVIRTGRFQTRPVADSRDEIGSLITTFDEMVDRLQEQSTVLEESEHRFRVLTETARDAIVSFLGNGQIILFNRQAEKIFGYRRNEILGMPVDRLVHEDCRVFIGGVEAYLRDNADKAITDLQRVVGRRRDGSPVLLEFSLSMAESDGRIFYTAILRPVEADKAKKGGE